MANQLLLKKFGDIKLSDHFFDSLKADYKEFPDWFKKKAEEVAYVLVDDATAALNGFVYLKVEDGPVADVEPALPVARRIKVGTLKINAHGTKLGERVIKKVFDKALHEKVDEIYVTVFPGHKSLIKLLERYGFVKQATKSGPNGKEDVLVRSLRAVTGDIIQDYPLLHTDGKSKYLLAIWPDYHTNLLPDSVLHTEKSHIVEDVSHTNTIHKIYIGRVSLNRMKRGDLVVMYRTTDQPGRAKYRSVATSVCVVEEVRSKRDFPTVDAFVEFAKPHSVYTEKELRDLFAANERLYAVQMTYNVAFRKRPIRAELMDDVGITEQPRWDLRKLTDGQFARILELGGVDEGIVVD